MCVTVMLVPVLWFRLIPQALPTVFSDVSEVINRDSDFELTDNVDLSTDISSRHVNNMAQKNGCYSAEVEHCIENIGNDVYSSDFVSLTLDTCFFVIKSCTYTVLHIQRSLAWEKFALYGTFTVMV